MDTIVVGYNDSPAARAALAWATNEARHRNARVLVVYVVSSIGDWTLAAIQVNTDPLRAALEQHLAGKWTAPLRDQGIDYNTTGVEGSVGKAIRAAAVQADVSMIVVGMTHRGALAEWMSDDPEPDLARHAARPFVAVPAGWHEKAD